MAATVTTTPTKSTLMQIVVGLLARDGGTVTHNADQHRSPRPYEAGPPAPAAAPGEGRTRGPRLGDRSDPATSSAAGERESTVLERDRALGEAAVEDLLTTPPGARSRSKRRAATQRIRCR